MTVAVINASPTAFGVLASAYGTFTWQSSPIVPQTFLPDSAGTLWIFWKVKGNIPPGQALNGVAMNGNNQYLVGSGLAVSRFGDVFVRMQKVYTDLTGQAGTYASTVIGTGTPRPMNYVHHPDNFFSDDFNAGNCYVGMAVRTNTADVTEGAGKFQLGALQWTFYFGSDTPGAVGGIQSDLQNPVENYQPGKLDYEDFASLRCVLTEPTGNQTSVHFSWELPTNLQGQPIGLTFDNGTALLSVFKGQSIDGGSQPYYHDCGPVHIADRMAEGEYTLRCTIDGIGALAPYTKTAQLVVRQNRAIMFMSEI